MNPGSPAVKAAPSVQAGSAQPGPLNPASSALSFQSEQHARSPAVAPSAPVSMNPRKATGPNKSPESAPAQQPASKKPKVAAGEPEQSIDQLNDTALKVICGIRPSLLSSPIALALACPLRNQEEEEQLLIGSEEGSHATEALRKNVREEEERFLERDPVVAKVAEIATRFGVTNVSEDVGRCKSMDDNAPTAADVDAFAAVLKGELGNIAAQTASAATHGVARPGNGAAQQLPQGTANTASPGQSGVKAVFPGTAQMQPGQQQLLWKQFTAEQRRELHLRTLQEQQLLQPQQQQQQQQPQQQKVQQQQAQLPPSAQQALPRPQQQNQQGEPAGGNTGNRKVMSREGISFTALMPLLQPHLPPEQGQQLAHLYQRFKRNEITREDFIRGARTIAGDSVLVQTIRQMQQKQQALQQQKAQLAQPPQAQLQAQVQAQPHPSQPAAQQLHPHVGFTGAGSASSQDSSLTKPQQQTKDQTAAAQQSSQPNAFQGTPKVQDLNVPSSVQQRGPSGHPQTQLFQQAQALPSSSERQILASGSQSQGHLPAFPLPKAEQQTDSGHGQQASGRAAAKSSQQDKGHGAKTQGSSQLSGQTASSPILQGLQPQQPPVQLQSSSILPQPPLVQPQALSASSKAQITVPTIPGPTSQSYGVLSLSQPSFSGNVVPAAPQPTPQSHAPQVPVLALPSAQQIPVAPPPQPAPPAPVAKPLTKYAKQKLRREQKKQEELQKKKEEEERAAKAAEEEKMKLSLQEESTKEQPATSSGAVPPTNQGLRPNPPSSQLPLPQIDLNKKSYGHQVGSFPQQAQLPAPVTLGQKKQGVSVGSGESLLSVKQEPSDLSSDQKKQSFHIPGVPDPNSAQTLQKSDTQVQLPDVSVLSTSGLSHTNDPGTSAEQGMLPSLGGAGVPSSYVVVGSVQQPAVGASAAALGGAPSLVAGASGLQPPTSTKQRMNPGSPAVSAAPSVKTGAAQPASLNAASSALSPQSGQHAQTAAVAPSAPVSKNPRKATGQKKSAESAPAQQPASKKPKVAGGEPEQSIDQLNDVTAVSGVNLKEEEEQLLIGPKEESHATEAMRKIVREEEERLFLERGPLLAKIAEIATRCGVTNVSEDVGRCISMSLEERLRSMLYRLTKLAKQRCDVYRERYKIVTTSDTRRQILLMKRKAKELLDKKNAEESERLRRLNEKKEKGSRPEVEREELRAKAQKAQQEEEDRLKANAANVAARAAVGADDMLLKWQMMAEKGRKKRQGGDAGGGEDGAADQSTSSTGNAPHSDKKSENGDSGTDQGNPETSQLGVNTTLSTGRPAGAAPVGATRALSGSRAFMSRFSKNERVITVKDVIAFLETEPQMSKSPFLYRLYERKLKALDGDKGLNSGRK